MEGRREALKRLQLPMLKTRGQEGEERTDGEREREGERGSPAHITNN